MFLILGIGYQELEADGDAKHAALRNGYILNTVFHSTTPFSSISFYFLRIPILLLEYSSLSLVKLTLFPEYLISLTRDRSSSRTRYRIFLSILAELPRFHAILGDLTLGDRMTRRMDSSSDSSLTLRVDKGQYAQYSFVHLIGFRAATRMMFNMNEGLSIAYP